MNPHKICICCLAGIMAALWPGLSRAQSSPAYTIKTVAGNGTAGYSGDKGPATSAQIYSAFSVAVDAAGNLYIADGGNNCIRKVDGTGTITTVAGNGTAGFSADGTAATSAEIADPQGVALDASGNLYIADSQNSLIRMVGSNGQIATVVGNINEIPGFSGDGGPAVNAQIYHPSGLTIDNSGNLYIADTSNNLIRMVAPSTEITTVAGNGQVGHSGDGGSATNAQLKNPEAVAVDAAGNLYIADASNNRIRKVVNGTITTVAGNGTAGYSGDGGRAINAELNNPEGVAVDASGNIFIADEFNDRIRMVTPSGTITTVAGTGSAGYSGDGGTATSAQLFFPSGVAVDAAGRIFVADNQNNRIRLLTPVPQPPSISAGGVVSAGQFGAFSSIAPGSWIEIYGSNLAAQSRSWTTADFSGVNAPTSLDGTKVTIGGQAAFVAYISGGQVNAQVPSNVAAGSQPVTVTTANGTSAAYTVTVNATQPGLFAPSSLNIGGKQYAGAFFSDGTTYVLPPGAVASIASREAKPGETITLYGTGFGPVTPTMPAGEIIQQSNAVVQTVEILFGQTPATLSYWGLAPGEIGLYQFNVVVPNITSSDAVPLTFTLGGVAGTQTLYTAVQN